jgi:hypothetical protein
MTKQEKEELDEERGDMAVVGEQLDEK